MFDAKEFLELAGENAAKAAEDYITRDLFDVAIESMKAAKDLNPKLTARADNYIEAYNVQKAVHLNESFYKVLGVEDEKASSEKIKKQFKKMALALHPDKNNSVVAASAFKNLSNAYEVLSNESKRLAYDQRMGFIATPKSRPQPKRARDEWRRYANNTEDEFDAYMKSQGWKRAVAMPSSTQPSYPFKATPVA